MECLNSRVDLKDLQLGVEPFRFFGNNLFGSVCFLLSVLEIGGDNGFEVVNIVKEGVINLTHIGVYITWYSDVNEKHIPVLAFPHDTRERLSFDKIIGGIGRTNNDVGIHKEIEVAIISDRCPLKLLRDVDSAFIRTICNNHVRDTV